MERKQWSAGVAGLLVLATAMVMAQLAVSGRALAQAVPARLNYQGKLYDSGGQPVNDASMPMVFSLWDKDVTAENEVNEQVLMDGTAAHPLAHQDLTPGSEVVTGLGGTPAYQTPRDYTIDYANGTITRVDAIAGGLIADGETVEVDYAWTSYGSTLWSEGQAVEVVNGLYQVKLGEVNPITAPVFAGGSAYLEVVVDGSTLSPRQELTSVPFALRSAEADDSDLLDGLDSLDFSLAGHTHDFTEITGAVTDAQVPDNITVSLAENSSQLNGLPSDAFVLVAGDTMTGHLQVNGPLSTGQDLSVAGDATISGGHLGLGTAPLSSYGISNDAATAPSTGAYLYGASSGLNAALASDPSDHFASLGSTLQAVFGRCGNSDETDSRYGGRFYAYTQGTAYGVYGAADGYSAAEAMGVYGIAQNDGSGPAQGLFGYGYKGSSAGYSQGVFGYGLANGPGNAYGGYFGASPLGTGTHYGVYADADDYSGWFQGGRVHVGKAGTEDYVDGDGDLYVEDELEADGNAYVGGDATVSGGNLGLGVLASPSYGIINDSATAPGYGAYLYGSSYGIQAMWAGDPADHYAYLGSASYGVYSRSGNSDETGVHSGGGFYAYSQNLAYGVYGAAYGYSTDVTTGVYGIGTNNTSGLARGVLGYGSKSSGSGDSQGVYGYGYNTASGDAYGGYFKTAPVGTGTHYGVYANADDYPVWAEYSSDPADHYAFLGSSNYGVFGKCGNSDETGNKFGGYFSSYSQGSPYGVYGLAQGYSVNEAVGAYGYAINNASGAARGVYGTAYKSSGYDSSYGVFGEAYNETSSGNAYGGYFNTPYSSGTGKRYGVYARAEAFDVAYGLYAYATSSYQAYGVYNASGTKNWVNPDPEDPDKSIAYVTVESGENLTYCRGTATLVNGHAEITLPDHFRKVTSPDHPVTVQATPGSADSLGLAVTFKSNSRIVVDELYKGTGNYQFDYTVQGIRLGYEDYQPIIDNVDYVPFQGNQSSLDESEMTSQEWYDAQLPGLKRIFKQNGTLDKDGKVNEALFQKKGWKDVKEKKEKPRGQVLN